MHDRFTGRPNFDDCDREDVLWFEALELRFRLFVLPPRALNVGNPLPSSAAIAELPLVDGLQPLETLPVEVDDAKFWMSLHWSLPIASKLPSRYSTGGRDLVHALVTASHSCCEPLAQCISQPNKKSIQLTI